MKKNLTRDEIKELFNNFGEVKIFYEKDFDLCCEMWEKENNNYYFNFNKEIYTEEECIECIKYLLKNYKCKLYYGKLKEIIL